MQHQTLPDAPTSNEGGENKDLLVILFVNGCRTLQVTPKKTMVKNNRTLIGKQIKAEMDNIDGRLMTLCAFDKQLEENGVSMGNISQSILMDCYLTKDSRWIDDLGENFKDVVYYKQQYLFNLKKMVKADRFYTNDMLSRFNDLLKKIATFADETLSPLNNELRYKQVKAIEEADLISTKSLTALKLYTYNICDDLRDKWGGDIAKYCTNNENEIITEMLKEEYDEKKSVKSTDIRTSFSIQELALLNEKIEKGEKFMIYRGFAIAEDKDKHQVRKGLKTDGDLYYLQDAGSGLSYTLVEEVAFYFAYIRVCGDKVLPKLNNNRYLTPNQVWYIPNDKFINVEEENIRGWRLRKKLRPIIAIYECDPKKIKGYNLLTNEAEVIVKPEDLKIIDYYIPHSLFLAKKMWEKVNRTKNMPGMLRYGAIADGLTCFSHMWEDEILSVVYAETENVRESLEEFIEYGRKPTEKCFRELWDIFLDNAVVIPPNINPFVCGNGLFEYMKNPTNIKREKDKVYVAKTSYIIEMLKKQSQPQEALKTPQKTARITRESKKERDKRRKA